MNVRRTSPHVIGPGIRYTAWSGTRFDPQTSPHGSERLVSSDFEVVGTSSGELGNVVGWWRVLEGPCAVHPPIYEIKVLEGLHCPVRVDVRWLTPPHGGDIDRHVCLGA
jgi:hypothetical protein